MKKLSFLICMAVAVASFSFIAPGPAPSVVALNNVQFKVVNDTSAPVDYFVDGQHHTIDIKRSVGFSYPAQTVVYKWTNGAQGAAWFTVTAEMQGSTVKVSGLPQ